MAAQKKEGPFKNSDQAAPPTPMEQATQMAIRLVAFCKQHDIPDSTILAGVSINVNVAMNEKLIDTYRRGVVDGRNEIKVEIAQKLGLVS